MNNSQDYAQTLRKKRFKQMAYPELLDYVRTAKRNGASLAKIKERLRAVGWTEAAIGEAIAAVTLEESRKMQDGENAEPRLLGKDLLGEHEDSETLKMDQGNGTQAPKRSIVSEQKKTNRIVEVVIIVLLVAMVLLIFLLGKL
jgi:hypothetical protein